MSADVTMAPLAPHQHSGFLPSDSGLPSPGKLASGISDALATIDELLESSGSARKDFRSGWDGILESYEADVNEIERALARLPPSFEEYIAMRAEARKKQRSAGARRGRAGRKKKRRAPPSNISAIYGDGGGGGAAENDDSGRPPVQAAHHALNFHLTNGNNSGDGDADDIFFLPPEEEEDDMTVSSSISPKANRERGDDAASVASTTRAAAGASSSSSKRSNADQVRFHSREGMFLKMEEMRDAETRLEERLFGEDSEGITDRERRELECALDRCRSRNSKQVIDMISKYRPKRFRQQPQIQLHPASPSSKSTNKSVDGGDGVTEGCGGGVSSPEGRIERLGLTVPSLEDLMEEVNVAVAADEQRRLKSSEKEDIECGARDSDDDEEEIDGSIREEESSCHGEETTSNGVLSIPTYPLYAAGDVRNEPIEEEEELPMASSDSGRNEKYSNSTRTKPAGTSLLRDSNDERPSESLVCADMEHFTPIQHLPLIGEDTTHRGRHGGPEEEKAAAGGIGGDDAAPAPTSLMSLVQSHTQPVKIGPSRRETLGTATTKNRDDRPQHLFVGGAGHTAKPLVALDAQIRKDLGGYTREGGQLPMEETTEALERPQRQQSPPPCSPDAPGGSLATSITEDYGSDDFDDFDDDTFEDDDD